MARVAAIAAVLALAVLPAAAAAQAEGAWAAARQAEFYAWRAANPDVESRLPELKRRTAALIAAYVPPPAGLKYADARAQSAGLSTADRGRARTYFEAAAAWSSLGDWLSAKEFLDLGLALDPANVAANARRGDFYLREAEAASDSLIRDWYRVNAALYYDRAATLGPGAPEAQAARAALASLPHVEEKAGVEQPPVIWRVADAPKALWDAPYAPRLAIIPAGEYAMGSPPSETKSEATRSNTEIPRHRVRIAYPLAVGRYPVTKAEFRAFVEETGYRFPPANCPVVGMAGRTATWEDPGFPQTEDDPVSCMSFDSATAYVKWLSAKTGHTYRLLSEAEWEYAARAGTTTAYYWGDEVGSGHANCPGCGGRWDNKSTSPVGSFAPNPFGLYDMIGNSWELVGDCWSYTYLGAPTDGSASRAGPCVNSVERGGNFSQGAVFARAAFRGGRGDPLTRGLNIHGFRVARVL